VLAATTSIAPEMTAATCPAVARPAIDLPAARFHGASAAETRQRQNLRLRDLRPVLASHWDRTNNRKTRQHDRRSRCVNASGQAPPAKTHKTSPTGAGSKIGLEMIPIDSLTLSDRNGPRERAPTRLDIFNRAPRGADAADAGVHAKHGGCINIQVGRPYVGPVTGTARWPATRSAV
jgi:hypothetical protein